MTIDNTKGPFLGQRHLQSLLLFFAIVVNFTSKYNVSVAVVAMTNAATTNPDFEEYDWNERQKSYILSSFYWGYLISQFPSGYVCRQFGVKRTLFAATLMCSILAILPPFCVPWGGWQVYCGILFVQGIFQGPLFPCVYAHLAAWCPVNERNRLGAFSNTGMECGIVLSMFCSGKIAVSSMGWPGIFYMTGAVGLSWCVFWLLWGANCPTKSKFISNVECVYIISSRNGLTEKLEVPKTKRKIPIPWRAIFTSVPFWALLVARSGESWGFSTIQAEITSYMNGVLNMDMSSNALYSALPYLAMWCMSYVFLIISDVLLKRKLLSLTGIRKLFNSIASWLPALGLLFVGFLDEEQKTWAVVLMTAIVGINASSTIGSLLNTIDLSPNHAGMLMSIINSITGIMTLGSPLLVGIIVQNKADRIGWQTVFIIAAVIFAVSNLVYLIFGSTKLQAWDSEDFTEMKRDIENNTMPSAQNDDSSRETFKQFKAANGERFMICELCNTKNDDCTKETLREFKAANVQHSTKETNAENNKIAHSKNDDSAREIFTKLAVWNTKTFTLKENAEASTKHDDCWRETFRELKVANGESYTKKTDVEPQPSSSTINDDCTRETFQGLAKY